MAVNTVQMDGTAFPAIKHIATRVKVKPRKGHLCNRESKLGDIIIIIPLLTDTTVISSSTPTAPSTSSGNNVKLFKFLYG